MMQNFFFAVNSWGFFPIWNIKGTQLKINGHDFSILCFAVCTEVFAIFVKTSRKTEEEQRRNKGGWGCAL